MTKKYSTLMERREAKKKALLAMPVWRRRWVEFSEKTWWWIRHGWRNKIRDWKFAIRVRMNRAIHGYDEYDWWEFFHNNSVRAVKLLTIFREKHHGYPAMLHTCKSLGEEDDCQCNAEEKWKNILDDMIFYHKFCAGMVRYADKQYLEFEDLTKEDQYRYRKGRYYFYRYYLCLWD